MRQSTLQERADGFASLASVPGAWRPVVLALVVSAAILGFVFFREFRAAVEVWNASTAYGHCYLVPPMAAYLLWERRASLAQALPRPEPGWAILALLVAACWLVAERLGIMEGRQLAAIAGFELLFLVVLGRRLYWILSGPLLYLFFLVPFGAFLTPALQRFTAVFSIVGLDLLGIPNFSDNFVIETPAGTFFVAEACAGLRFLIAAVAFGVFYALLNFRSPVRRVLFIAASIAVPIVANGFRALGIVVLGQVLGSAEAAAADHIIYGWVFFSAVMLLLVAAGHPFRESSTGRAAVSDNPTGRRDRTPVWGALATVLLVGVGPAVATAIDTRVVEVSLAASPALRIPPGCDLSDPGLSLAAGTIRSSIRCGDRVFEVQIMTFPARSTASALVVERRKITQEIGAEDVTIAPLGNGGDDAGTWLAVQTTEPNRLTAVASWVDGKPVRSSFAGRLAQARDSLLGAEYAPVLMTVSTQEAERASPQQRRAALDGLRALVNAQPDLDVEIARSSHIAGAAPGSRE